MESPKIESPEEENVYKNNEILTYYVSTRRLFDGN